VDGNSPAQLLPYNGIFYPPRTNPSGNQPPTFDANNQNRQTPPGGRAQIQGRGDGANRTPFNQEVGQAGALRMFTAPLVDEASWLLPFALLGLPVLIAVLGIRWPLTEQQLGGILWAGWMLPAVVYFSFTTGLFHAYYVVMLGPPLAALVGATAWALHKINRQHPWRGWILIGLLTAATILVQAFAVISTPGYAAPIILTALLLWLAGQHSRLCRPDHLDRIAALAGRVCPARTAEMGSHPPGRICPARRRAGSCTHGLVLRNDVQPERQRRTAQRRSGS